MRDALNMSVLYDLKLLGKEVKIPESLSE